MINTVLLVCVLLILLFLATSAFNKTHDSMKDLEDIPHIVVPNPLVMVTDMMGQIQNQLGRVEESNKKVFELGQGLNELRNILKNSKLRGGMGEFLLEDLLRQVLPAANYKIQYPFSTGEVVDAAVLVGQRIVSIDSKFPLESFIRLSNVPEHDAEARRKEKRAFIAAIKKHADAIAYKYIKQNENTFDFALMYIPAENVYYETVIRDDLMEDGGSLHTYFLSRKVIPVSPNMLYAYLQVIVLGLRGFQVEANAAKIVSGLSNINDDMKRLAEGIALTGKHLKNAAANHDENIRKLDQTQQKCASLAGADLNKKT